MVGSLWRDQRAALVLTGLAAVAALAWIVVGVVTPTRGVVLIGPVDSGRLRIFLVGAAATAAAAAVVLVLLRQARRRGTAAAVACGLGVVAVATGWFATCAMCLAVSVFEPSYERAAVPGGCPAVVVQLAEGPLIANDVTHVAVLSGVCSTFRPVPHAAPPADTVALRREGLTVAQTQAGPVLRYPAFGGGEAEVALPTQ
ncbi:hypothetical protein [Aeromicrobium erythreum]|uniref:Uncharacterized protein n=1 Tax=Aeromicrobium erythreum TaxID=2041 RepID=A0A0U4C5R2_9ACTN|nr:hypothetical protein [Aeromicrobium erythreum]ALX03483.1 hypothetical protein AERYTH_01615 [Aeromicrobium erythreum]